MDRRSSSRKPKAPPAGTAVDCGLRLLGRRAHSRMELRRKLERRAYEAVEIDRAMARLIELGYLDDAGFARDLVRGRSVARGARALAAELAAKGIDRAGIDAALGGLDGEDQLATATRLAERLYGQAGATGDRGTLDRIGQKLLRRGFSIDVARAACRAAMAAWAEAARRPGAEA